MAVNSTGYAYCQHCGAEYHSFTIFNRDMQGLANGWKRRHEWACRDRSPAQRRQWAKRYAKKNGDDSGVTVDLRHPGFQEPPKPVTW